MSFVRPEVQTSLLQWRETLIGIALLCLGGYWSFGVGGLLGWIGIVVALAGIALAFVGMQRARFRARGRGPGVVLIDEGEITYMGPLNGGSVAVAELSMLVLDPTARPAHWVLQPTDRTALHIPVNADGADQLFDAFAGLPGIKTSHMLAQLHGAPEHPVVIWERHPHRAAPNQLH
ncbi:MAG: hypothetical protein AAGA05_11615 [Pseudomonadota bacterium]